MGEEEEMAEAEAVEGATEGIALKEGEGCLRDEG